MNAKKTLKQTHALQVLFSDYFTMKTICLKQLPQPTSRNPLI